MTITIFYFAQLAEERGLRSEIVQVAVQSLTLRDLFSQIFARDSQGIRFAQNQEYVPDNTQISDGDEIAFIPPLGGG
jgi:molybdopterin converting factor small subunit